MRVLVCLAVVFVVVAASGCAPNVVGVWGGDTSDCSNANDDGTGVTLSVTSQGQGTVATALGFADSDTAVACEGNGGDLDDLENVAFTQDLDCDGRAIAYVVDLAHVDDDTQRGTVRFTVDGGEPQTCKLTATR